MAGANASGRGSDALVLFFGVLFIKTFKRCSVTLLCLLYVSMALIVCLYKLKRNN